MILDPLRPTLSPRGAFPEVPVVILHNPASSHAIISNTPLMLPQTRKTITRSRNGCAICKSKRLKCDEVRPSCSRCTRLGIACPGYQKPIKWSARQKTSKSKPNFYESGVSATPSDWISYTFNLGQPQPTNQSVVEISSYGTTKEAPASIDAGSTGMLDNNNFTSPLSFDELSQEMDLLPHGTPWIPTSPEAQEMQKDRSWLNTNLDSIQPEVDRFSSLDSARQCSQPRCQLPLPKAIQDHSSILVEYYFKEVCGMMSCYDSKMNPYRTTISESWSGSSSLYYTTQSMAAACLSEVSPKFSSVGLQFQNKAASCVLDEMRENYIQTSTLLALVMLGMSRCWHSPGEVGQSEFETLARTVLSSEAIRDKSDITDGQRKIFFQSSIVYWQVLLAFVSDKEPNIQDMKQKQPQPAQTEDQKGHETKMPHPQTGVGTEIQILVAKVGSLVRKERNRIRSRRFASRVDIDQAHKAILLAEQLQYQLCSIQLPNEDDIVDSGDELTPPSHLIKIAEAYRCTGLLQLYRNFPDLLTPYTSSNDPLDDFVTFSPAVETSSNLDAEFSENTENPWLIYLALHILHLIEEVPISSTSRSIQPFLLVSICSELDPNRAGCSMVDVRKLPLTSLSSSPKLESPVTEIEILQARSSIISRLSSFENMLAAKPIQQMTLLVKETWAWMETKQSDAYWMDVMMERGYETLMG